jgi:hypothetical protein
MSSKRLSKFIRVVVRLLLSRCQVSFHTRNVWWVQKTQDFAPDRNAARKVMELNRCLLLRW